MTDIPKTDVDDSDDSRDRKGGSVDRQAGANSSASAYREGDSEDASRDTSCVTEEPLSAVDSDEGPVMIESGPGDEQTFSCVDDASIDDCGEGTTRDLSRKMEYVMGEPQSVDSTPPSDDTRDETPIPTSGPSSSSGDKERSAKNVDLGEDEIPDPQMDTVEESDVTGRLSDGVNDAVVRSARRRRAFLHVDEECIDEDVLLDESVLDTNAIFASVDDPSGDRSSEDASGDFSRDLSYLMGEPIPAGSTPAGEEAAVKSAAVGGSDNVIQSDAAIESSSAARHPTAENTPIEQEVVAGAESSGADTSSSEVHNSDLGEGLSQDASEDISGDASYVFGQPKLIEMESPVEKAEARGQSVAAPQFSTGDESVGDQSHDRSMDVSRDSRHVLGKPTKVSVEDAAGAHANPAQWATALPGEEIAAPVANDANEFPAEVDGVVDQLELPKRVEAPEIVDESEQIEESSTSAEETLTYEDDLPGESYFGDVSKDTSPSGLEEVSRVVKYVMGEPQSVDTMSSASYGSVEEEEVTPSGSNPIAQFAGTDAGTSLSDFSREVSVDAAESSSIKVGKPLEVALKSAAVPRKKSRAWLKGSVGATVVVGGIFVAVQLGLLDVEPASDEIDETAVTQSTGRAETADTTTSSEVPGETATDVTSTIGGSPTVHSNTTPPTTPEPALDPDEPFFDPNSESSPLLSDAEKPDWLKAVWARLNDGAFNATDLMNAEATITKWLSATPVPPLDLAERLRRLQRQISELSPSTVAQTDRRLR